MLSCAEMVIRLLLASFVALAYAFYSVSGQQLQAASSGSTAAVLEDATARTQGLPLVTDLAQAVIIPGTALGVDTALQSCYSVERDWPARSCRQTVSSFSGFSPLCFDLPSCSPVHLYACGFRAGGLLRQRQHQVTPWTAPPALFAVYDQLIVLLPCCAPTPRPCAHAAPLPMQPIPELSFLPKRWDGFLPCTVAPIAAGLAL